MLDMYSFVGYIPSPIDALLVKVMKRNFKQPLAVSDDLRRSAPHLEDGVI